MKAGETELLYDPETINWGARSRVEAWSRNDGELTISKPKKKNYFGAVIMVVSAVVIMGLVAFRTFF